MAAPLSNLRWYSVVLTAVWIFPCQARSCLNLNVTIPSDIPVFGVLPVVIFIHGGCFIICEPY